MFRFFSMIFFFVITFSFLITAELKPLNNLTTIELMNKLPIILVPTSYAFLIYLFLLPLLIVWLIGYWRSRFEQPKRILRLRAILFNLNLVFIVMSTVLWHYELILLTLLSFVGLLISNALCYFTYDKTDNHLFTRLPVSLFFGWHVLSLMFLGNYTLRLVEWSGWGISQPLWSVIFLTITTAVGLHFLYHYKDIGFNLALMWGFIHIALNNGFDSLFVTTASLFLTAVIAACYFIFNNKKTQEVQIS